MPNEYTNALPSGTRLDTYQIEKVLGVGGFGITYLARELNLGKSYAIKELLPDGIAVRQAGETTVKAKSSGNQGDFEATRKYFISEARILAGMSHPAVVSVHRLMETNGTCYMVMDYVEGETLGDYLKKQGGRLGGVEEFEQIFFPLMSGLEALHSQEIIHRDIKPGNIMVQPDGSPVLLDFGAATQTQSKTVTITQMLSAGYSPFEQYTSRAKQGPYTDIYALGATMFKCITGQKPDDASDRMYGDSYQPIANASQYKADYNRGILEGVDAALRMDAKLRPQTVSEWRAVMGGEADSVSSLKDKSDATDTAPKVPKVVEEVPSPPPLPAGDVKADTINLSPSNGPAKRVAAPIITAERWMRFKRVLLACAISGGLVLIFSLVMVFILGGKKGDKSEGDTKVSSSGNSVTEPSEPTPDHQYKLGLRYANGEGVSQDFTKAFFHFRQAALAGHAAAQNYFGWMYANGKGVSKDQREAVKWYRKAAEQGNAQGQNNLGLMYANGRGVVKDEREAVKWYRKSAEQGNAWGQNFLGVMYANGRGVVKDEREAVKWYWKAAVQGHAMAQGKLGWMYANGRGVSKDDREAVKWYRKAADHGEAEAQWRLGWMYANGEGVSKDEREAVIWYRKAAEQGNETGQHLMGLMYEIGKGVTKDEREAVKWYRKAAEQGDAGAQYSLGIMYSNGRGVAKDDGEAVNWYRKAAEQGNARAQYSLGWHYLYGKGVVRNQETAKLWLQKASMNNNAEVKKAAEELWAERPK